MGSTRTTRNPLAQILARPAWFSEANCRGMDPEEFFPSPSEWPYEALRACAGCTVREQCLDHALANDERGVWAGTSQRERARMRRGVA